MKTETIQVIAQLLQRVEIKGSEVQTFNEVMHALQEEVAQNAQDSNVEPMPAPSEFKEVG